MNKSCDTLCVAYATGILPRFQLELSCDECVRSSFQFNNSFDICVYQAQCIYIYRFVFGKHLSIHSNRHWNETQRCTQRKEKRDRAREGDMEISYRQCALCLIAHHTQFMPIYELFSYDIPVNRILHSSLVSWHELKLFFIRTSVESSVHKATQSKLQQQISVLKKAKRKEEAKDRLKSVIRRTLKHIEATSET